ncbi:hypothetical protein AAY24_11560 [Sedimenticola thiotaurini]|uniref:Uncharacterized protein n=1 Tax=Sedimenticola thiotaurini TaxID=1543721 RepID=A0A0F7JWK2_9GAMM|nr:hypothetical protein AAY24_11560 [Sedimenticola thiotaurini]
MAGLLWWGSFNVMCNINQCDYAFWVSAPFWVLAAVAILGFFGAGPLGKKYKEALLKDAEEEREMHRAKQPWE